MRYSLFSVPVTMSVASAFLFIAGCVNQPLLLRNRPNVPPPVLAPASIVDEEPDVAVDVVKDITPVTTLSSPKKLPAPEIKTTPITYTVKKGDTFWGIARKFGVDKNELATCNNLSIDKPLKIGVVLVIPPGGGLDVPAEIARQPKRAPVSIKAPTQTKVAYAPSAGDGTYVVRPSDTLWKIARRNNITTKSLAKANNLDLRKPIQPGMKLIIPGGSHETKVPAEVETTVAPEPSKKAATTEVVEKSESAVEDDETDLLDDAVKAADSQKNNGDSKKSVDDILDGLDPKTVDSSSSEAPGSPYTEEVIPNETLQEIADRHGCTVEEILKVNPTIKSEDDLKPFTTIVIPKK